MKSTAAKPAMKKRNRPNGRRYGDIKYKVKNQVAWVTINRPRVLNAFREQTLDELIDALKATRNDPSIACAVVTGAGNKAFSAGGDFYAMKRLTWTNAAMWNDRMQGHSPQTLRMTKKSLNFESDLLYASWQHGMELLAHVWGSEESLEGMNAFLEGRKPDFQRFRMRNKQELEEYLDGCAKNLNAPPSMRKAR